MEFHNRLLRVTAESIVKKTIRDIRHDAGRSIRKGIDLGSTFARGELQKEFFELAGRAACSPLNPYKRLITRGVGTIDGGILRTVGVNLGMTSFTSGVRQIRTEYENTRHSIPWLEEFDFSSPEKIPRGGLLALITARCRSRGIGAFWCRADRRRAAVSEILDTAARLRECTFFLAVSPGCLGEAEAGRILSAKNIVVLLSVERTDETDEKKAAAFRLLQKYRLLYGFLFRYGADSPADVSAGFLREMIGRGCFTGIYRQAEEEPDDHPVYRFVCASRRQCVRPILLFDFRRDVCNIQELILQKRHFIAARADPLSV